MKKFLRTVGSKAALLIVGWLMIGEAGSIKVYAMAEVPPGDMQCAEAPFANDNFIYIKCDFPPHIGKFVSENSDWSQKGALLIPRYPTKKLKLRAFFNGYSARPIECDNWDEAKYDYITTKNCPGHYPDLYGYPSVMLDWGGVFNGELAYGWRISAMFTKAYENWGGAIDSGAGVTLEGTSYGGATSIIQSLILPDPWWRNQISIVNANLTPTLFVNVDSTPFDGINQDGNYWRDPAIWKAWGNTVDPIAHTSVGAYNIKKANIVKRAKTIRHIYYRVNGSPADTIVVFDLDFFRKVCDKKKIACFGTWHNAGHNPTEPGVNLPFENLYSGPDMQVRLDTMLPVFTNSTANYWGKRGHYNLGLEWANTSQPFIDSKNKAVVPIRYLRHTNMGGDIPDQPLTATFDLTIRRPSKFMLPVGQIIKWSIGDRSGQVTVTKEGVVTVPGITLDSSTKYTSLLLTK